LAIGYPQDHQLEEPIAVSSHWAFESITDRSFEKSPIAPFSKCHRSLSVAKNVTDRSLFKMLSIGYSDWGRGSFFMRIRTSTDLGAYLRARRCELGMDQATLAEKAGTSRKWLIEVERGKPGASIGMLLRTLRALDVAIDLSAEKPANRKERPTLTKGQSNRASVDLREREANVHSPKIDELLDALRKSTTVYRKATKSLRP
jgi:HTH-type transcriptional regulator/antitoxin HipB